MPKHVCRVVMTMLPNKRHGDAVLVLEGVGHDSTPVAALKTDLSGPSTEVGLTLHSHFERSLSLFV